MINSISQIKQLGSSFLDSKPLIVFNHPSIQKVYQAAVMIFRTSIYALFTYLSPMGSFAVSLGCYTVCQYYKWVQEAKIKKLQQTTEKSQEMIHEALDPDPSLDYMNRLQQEFELVNLVTLTTIKAISLPFFILLGGMFIFNRFEDYQARVRHDQEKSLMLAELNTHSPVLGN